jgi:hypothetical protein
MAQKGRARTGPWSFYISSRAHLVAPAILPPAHIHHLLRSHGSLTEALRWLTTANESRAWLGVSCGRPVAERTKGTGGKTAGATEDRRRHPKLKAFSHRFWRTCDTMTFPPLEYRMEVRTRKHGPKTTVQERLDLPALRQHRGISLREIADSTKISIRFLQAIEQGDFKQLPGGIYTTSYLRQYAREIGFEETTLLAYYQAVTAAAS